MSDNIIRQMSEKIVAYVKGNLLIYAHINLRHLVL